MNPLAKCDSRRVRAREDGCSHSGETFGKRRVECGAMVVRLSKSFGFEAAHDLPTFPDGHKCRRLHGHSFRFDVFVEGEVAAEKGYLIDYGDIKRVVDPIVRRL